MLNSKKRLCDYIARVEAGRYNFKFETLADAAIAFGRVFCTLYNVYLNS